jgi:NADPH:quinone reductase-like Zn-dependent oxidoreductase
MTNPLQFDAKSASAPRLMKACRVHRFGGSEVIAFEDVAPPAPGEGEVLVRVNAAGVGPWDAWVRAGKSVLPQPLPLTLGADLAGVVAAVGVGVREWKPGDAVFGVTNTRFTGAYAEFAIASAAMIAPKPAQLTDIDAAATPVVSVTAWQALFEKVKLAQGEKVLIHGAAGGVGAFALQLARRAGLRIIATASASDLSYVQSLGADQVVDHRAERFEDTAKEIDAVIDLVGGETQTRSFAVLKRGGSLVSVVSSPDQLLAQRCGVKAAFFLVDVTTERLKRIASLFEQGALTVEVGAVLPLASVRLAHGMLEGDLPRPRGKIVFRVAP